MGRAYTTTGIILNNSSGGTVVDSTGIVSLSNFSFTNGTAGAQDISGTAETVLTGGTISLTVTRTVNVLYLWKLQGQELFGGTNQANVTTRIRVDGTDRGRIVFGKPYNTNSMTLSNFLIRQEVASTIPITITSQLESVAGTPTFRYAEWGLSYVILGT